MGAPEITAFVSALAVLIGALWTIANGRRQSTSTESSALWAEAMELIKQLREDNARLNAENKILRQHVRDLESKM